MEVSAWKSHFPDFGIVARRSLIGTKSGRPIARDFLLDADRGVTVRAIFWNGGVANREVDARGCNSFGDPGDETDERGSGPDLRNRCLFEADDAENGPGLSRVIPCLRFWMLRLLSRSGADDSRMEGSLLIDKRGCAGVVSEPIGMLEGVA